MFDPAVSVIVAMGLMLIVAAAGAALGLLIGIRIVPGSDKLIRNDHVVVPRCRGKCGRGNADNPDDKDGLCMLCREVADRELERAAATRDPAYVVHRHGTIYVIADPRGLNYRSYKPKDLADEVCAGMCEAFEHGRRFEQCQQDRDKVPGPPNPPRKHHPTEVG